MNLLRGAARGGRVTAGDFVLERPGVPDGGVIVGVRPEALELARDGMPSLELRRGGGATG